MSERKGLIEIGWLEGLPERVCAVPWCAALAIADRPYCVVHGKYSDRIRPEELPPGAKPKTTGYHWTPPVLIRWPWGKAV